MLTLFNKIKEEKKNGGRNELKKKKKKENWGLLYLVSLVYSM